MERALAPGSHAAKARIFLLAFVIAAAAFAGGARPRSGVAADDVVIVVNSAADGSDGACPGDGTCTFRAAIDAANADESGATVRIVFDQATFPEATPARITLIDAPLPAVTRGHVEIDASSAAVIVSGASLPPEPVADGLVLAGDDAIIEGLAVVHFSGACISVSGTGVVIGGDPDFGEANRLGDCAVGVDVRGPGAFLLGNRIGFSAAGDARPQVGTGIVIDAVGATVGGQDVPDRLGNIIGNADIGIRVGAGEAATFAGTTVARNVIGRFADGRPAPVGTGILLSQFSVATMVSLNEVVNTGVAGIAVAADVDGASVVGNTFRGNEFAPRSGMAIDLGANGLRDANDGTSGAGPNAGLDHPILTRATQARVSGTACPGCAVELYRAHHEPGGAGDEGSVPVLVGIVGADGAGNFAFEAPPVAPGDWLTATATDGAGNTSEFGPSTRVGAGVIQCGNVTLNPGWNLVGFFGLSTVTLGETFPLDPGGKVAAIYARDNGDDTFRHWFRGAPVEATLTALEPGAPYWFFADETLTLPQGFALTAPLPVSLAAGWSEFVYFGASAVTPDALATIAGSWAEVYRYDNPAGPDEGWIALGAPDSPAWLQAEGIEACGAYAIRMTAPAVLTPLQP